MKINPSEITNILKDQIKNFGTEVEVSEVGQVLTVGDGIARVYGLDNVQAGEMVQFSEGTKGMALNLETENVGVVIFGDDSKIKEGDIVMFPSYTIHRAPIINNNIRKTIVSFNFILDLIESNTLTEINQL